MEEKLSLEEVIAGISPDDKNISMEDVVKGMDCEAGAAAWESREDLLGEAIKKAAENVKAVAEKAAEKASEAENARDINTEETTGEPMACDEQEPVESMDDFKAEIEASMKKLRVGDVVKGIIVGADESEVLVDMGYFTGGVISKENFSNDPYCILKDAAVIGEEITATVIEASDNEGRVVLSRKEANDMEMWERLNDYLINRTVLKEKVCGIVNGGVIVMVEGMRGFVPASKLSLTYVENLEEYLGKELELQVITADKDDNRLVLSAKELLLAKESEEKNKRIARCEVGSVVTGEVESIKKYGAFIKLDNGLSGLLHVSQITEKRIKSPAAVLNVGDRVTVKIISIENNRLSLSIKALTDVAETEKTDDDMPSEYADTASAATSLGSLLSGFKFD